MAYDLLLKAYGAAWDAILNFADLQVGGESLFVAKYRFDEVDADPSILRDLKPSESDLPAILIWPTPSVPDWYVNQSAKFPLALTIMIWTSNWAVKEPFELWEKTTRALFKSIVPGQTVPEVKRVTGFYPEFGGSVNFNRIRLGANNNGQQVMETSFTPVLRSHFNPLA